MKTEPPARGCVRCLSEAVLLRSYERPVNVEPANCPWAVAVEKQTFELKGSAAMWIFCGEWKCLIALGTDN